MQKETQLKVKKNIEGIIEDLKKRLDESAEVRRKEADWKFILAQTPKIVQALIELIHTGDILRSAKLAEMNPVEFDHLREKAGISYDL
ncbi:MAG: hypothetical protein ACFFCD_11395 [Promethearchaeota archaeon]